MRSKTPKDERESSKTFVTIGDFLSDNEDIATIKDCIEEIESDPRYSIWSDFIPIHYFEAEKFKLGMRLQDDIKEWKLEANFLFREKVKLAKQYADLLNNNPNPQYLEILAAKKDFLLSCFKVYTFGIQRYINIRNIHFDYIEREIQDLPGSFQSCKEILNRYIKNSHRFSVKQFYHESGNFGDIITKDAEIGVKLGGAFLERFDIKEKERKLFKKIEKAKNTLSNEKLSPKEILELEQRKIWDTKLKNAKAKARQKEMAPIHLQEAKERRERAKLEIVERREQTEIQQRIRLKMEREQEQQRVQREIEYQEEMRKHDELMENFNKHKAIWDEEDRKREEDRKIRIEEHRAKLRLQNEEKRSKFQEKLKADREAQNEKIESLIAENQRIKDKIDTNIRNNSRKKDLHRPEIHSRLDREGDRNEEVLPNLRVQAVEPLELGHESDSNSLLNNIKEGNMQQQDVEMTTINNNGNGHKGSKQVEYKTVDDTMIEHEFGTKRKTSNYSFFCSVGVPVILIGISSTAIGYSTFCLSKQLEEMLSQEYQHIILSVSTAIIGAVVMGILFKGYYDHHNRESVSLV